MDSTFRIHLGGLGGFLGVNRGYYVSKNWFCLGLFDSKVINSIFSQAIYGLVQKCVDSLFKILLMGFGG